MKYPNRKLAALSVAAVLMLPASAAWGTILELKGTLEVAGISGGTATFSDAWEQPTGTGVFDPFLTLRNKNGNTLTEKGYNTDGSPLYLDQHRRHWNTLLTLGDLAVNDKGEVCFLLDANEPGADQSSISIDNIRVYWTPAGVDNTALASGGEIDKLGTLAWAMNAIDLSGNPTTVELNANQNNILSNGNGGSGQADMAVCIPLDLFTDKGATDDSLIWFYNQNGSVNPVASDGYEEWRAVMRVPDGGSTLILLGLGLAGFAIARRRQA